MVMGIMSGTSLDGLDMAAVEFCRLPDNWDFSFIATGVVDYSGEWKEKLKNAPGLPGEQLISLHNEYGRFIGKEASRFLTSHNISADLIASHGHTVFHQPENGITFQLGNGAVIAAETGITTVADFRSGDVALGGQGAPLVPVGDRLLFPEYDFCLNLGGFANISFDQNRNRIAFDICPVNTVLNLLAETLGRPFDENGDFGRGGTVNPELLEKLNQLAYYQMKPPKSLGREWLTEYFIPKLNASAIPFADQLRTAYEHMAIQISNALPETGKTLLTGGGAFNAFLIERIAKHSLCELVIPSDQLIVFKEALIFAFLGLLRYFGENNCLATVTGARKDSSGGTVFLR